MAKSQPPLREPTDAESAYLAGFFDGEGCVTLDEDKRGYFKFALILDNTHLTPLMLLREVFGGTIRTKVPDNPNHNVFYKWRIHDRKARRALGFMFPFLRIKRPHAELAFEYAETLCRRGGTDRLSEQQRVLRRHLVTQSKLLNARGRKVRSNG